MSNLWGKTRYLDINDVVTRYKLREPKSPSTVFTTRRFSQATDNMGTTDSDPKANPLRVTPWAQCSIVDQDSTRRLSRSPRLDLNREKRTAKFRQNVSHLDVADAGGGCALTRILPIRRGFPSPPISHSRNFRKIRRVHTNCRALEVFPDQRVLHCT